MILRLLALAALFASGLAGQSKAEKAQKELQHQLDLQAGAIRGVQLLLDREREHTRDLNATIGSQTEVIRDLRSQLAAAGDQLRGASAAATAVATTVAKAADHALEVQAQSSARVLETTISQAQKPAAALAVSVGKLREQSKIQADTAEKQRATAADDSRRRAEEQDRFNKAQTALQVAFRKEIKEGFSRQNWALVMYGGGLMVLTILVLGVGWLVISWLRKQHKVTEPETHSGSAVNS